MIDKKDIINKIREIIAKLDHNVSLTYDELLILKNITKEEFERLQDILSTDDEYKYRMMSEYN